MEPESRDERRVATTRVVLSLTLQGFGDGCRIGDEEMSESRAYIKRVITARGSQCESGLAFKVHSCYLAAFYPNRSANITTKFGAEYSCLTNSSSCSTLLMTSILLL